MKGAARCRLAAVAAVAALVSGGCTRESVRVALEAQRRADEVHAAVTERQHEALCVLLHRDLIGRLESGGPRLDAAAREALAAAWNDRDLVEFWRIQEERARALRLIGVDAQLYGSQAAADLLWKNWQARAARGQAALAAAAGGALAEAAANPDRSEGSGDAH